MGENPTQNKNDEQEQSKVKKILNVAGDVLLVVLLVLAAFVLVVTISAKKDAVKGKDKVATVFGYQFRFVQSGSMAKCDATYDDIKGYKIKSIPVGSCVFVSTVPDDEAELKEWYKNIKVGDVLTFQYSFSGNLSGAVPITHRVIDIEPKGDDFLIYLQGDNRDDEDYKEYAKDGFEIQVVDTSNINVNYIIGKVTGQSRVLGGLVYAFGKPLGIVLLVILPCMIMIAFQVMRILKVLAYEKKEKVNEQDLKQRSEIEELKRQIEMLRQPTQPSNAGGNGTADGDNTADGSGGASVTQPETPPSAEPNE